jgi:uncharacterized protein (TIRG00374 family)
MTAETVPAPAHPRVSSAAGATIARITRERWVRAAIPPAIGLAAVIALVLAFDPASFARAIEHFNPVVLPAIIGVSIAYFIVQGVRWHFLLVDVGVRMRMRDVVLLTLAGQSTALLPLGEVTRSILVSQVSRAPFGAVVAAETVQELLYTVILILFAVPGLVVLPNALGGIIVILLFIALILVGMTWCPLYRYLRWFVKHTPLLKKLIAQVDELHNDLVMLLRRPGTIGWSWLSALQAAAAITVLWLVAAAIEPGALSWKSAALVFAVSNVAGLLSLIPAGLGAYEGSVIGLLISFGVNPGAAAATAIIQRLASQGIATGLGFASYGVARRRLGLSGLGTTMAVRPSTSERATPRPDGQAAAAVADGTKCSWRSAA